jgi:hypothetical protein
MIKNFQEYLNEAAESFAGKTFREIASMIKKQFPGVNLKTATKKKAYYSPKENDMEIFKLGDYFTDYLDVDCKEMIGAYDSKTFLEMARFLRKNKIIAWTNANSTVNYPSVKELYIISDTSALKIKKMEQAFKRDGEEKKREEETRKDNKIKIEDSKKRYDKLYDMLKSIPYNMLFSVPGIGEVSLSTLNSHQTVWKSWGHFRTYNSDIKEEVDELEKIVKYIYNESPLRTKLISKKFGI